MDECQSSSLHTVCFPIQTRVHLDKSKARGFILSLYAVSMSLMMFSTRSKQGFFTTIRQQECCVESLEMLYISLQRNLSISVAFTIQLDFTDRHVSNVIFDNSVFKEGGQAKTMCELG
jgi:hypothetical protein